MKKLAGFALFVMTIAACQSTTVRTATPAGTNTRGPLWEVHMCLTYVDNLVTSSLDASRLKSPEDLRKTRIGNPLLAQLRKIRALLPSQTIRWNDPHQSTRLLVNAERAMFHDQIVNQYQCELYFVGALAESVMLHSGGVKGSLYIETSKWSEENDEINAMIFANLISNVNVIEEHEKNGK